MATTRPVSPEATAVYRARLAKATRLALAVRYDVVPGLSAEDLENLVKSPERQDSLRLIEALAGTREASHDTWALVVLLVAFAEADQARARVDRVSTARLARELTVI
jgi:hypothetical protein